MTGSLLGPAASFAATDSTPDAALHLLRRATFGPRPGDLRALTQQGAAPWLHAQLHPREQVSAVSERLHQRLMALNYLSTDNAALVSRLAQAQLAQQRQAQDPGQPGVAQLVRELQSQVVEAKLLRALSSPWQLEELMVDFWFNHFNVFSGKELARVLIGDYEARAIRPFVFGRFRDMLGATARHPAMLVYLDNARSVGENSLAAQRAARNPAGAGQSRLGINENYARELLELHTLGVDGGYTQDDVIELARIFSGWGIERPGVTTPLSEDLFRFYPARHEPGPKRLLGENVPLLGPGDAALGEGLWALDRLARHPATARHIGFKLAQFFVADEPPESLVQRLAQVFLATDGDLRRVVQAVFDSPEMWQPQTLAAKYKTPLQQVVSLARALDWDPLSDQQITMRPLYAAIAAQGQQLYRCPTPDGFKYTRSAWFSADSMNARVNLALSLGRRVPRDGVAVLDGLLEQLGSKSRARILAAGPADRIALAMASPDFMVK